MSTDAIANSVIAEFEQNVANQHIEKKSAAGAEYTAATDGKSSKIKDMEELQEEAPEVYQAMLEGIAMKIIHSMRDSMEIIKEINREGREY